jgi:hypothetical protein
MILHALGGYVGGTLGAALPDVIEPAVHSHRRRIARSRAAMGGIAELTWKGLRGVGPDSQSGYLSHLALDATTPRAIPLLVRDVGRTTTHFAARASMDD